MSEWEQRHIYWNVQTHKTKQRTQSYFAYSKNPSLYPYIHSTAQHNIPFTCIFIYVYKFYTRLELNSIKRWNGWNVCIYGGKWMPQCVHCYAAYICVVATNTHTRTHTASLPFPFSFNRSCCSAVFDGFSVASGNVSNLYELPTIEFSDGNVCSVQRGRERVQRRWNLSCVDMLCYRFANCTDDDVVVVVQFMDMHNVHVWLLLLLLLADVNNTYIHIFMFIF